VALVFPTPPTFSSPVIVNPQTGQNQFNPIWLQWFLTLASFLGGTTVGRIRDIIPVTGSGIYNPTNGTNNIIMALWGGGAGGRTAAATGAGQLSVGAGGGAGGFTFGIFSTGFTGQLVSIGGGGASDAAGGNSTFLGLTAGGGQPGAVSTVMTGAGFSLGGMGGASSGGILNGSGQLGGQGIALSLTVASSGEGANSGLGTGGQHKLVAGPGVNASGFASGGSGGLTYASASAQAGGSGAPGCAFIMELS